MKYLIILLLSIPMQAYACQPTDGQLIELIGKVIPSVHKTESKIVHYRAVQLSEASCFMADNEFANENQNAQELQLVLTENINIEVGQKYKFKGDAYHAHTAHHFTKVLFNVKSAKKL
jgi:hypothetical protein